MYCHLGISSRMNLFQTCQKYLNANKFKETISFCNYAQCKLVFRLFIFTGRPANWEMIDNATQCSLYLYDRDDSFKICKNLINLA